MRARAAGPAARDRRARASCAAGNRRSAGRVARGAVAALLCSALSVACGDETSATTDSGELLVTHDHGDHCLAELHELSEEQGGGRIEVWRCDPTPLLPVVEAAPWFGAWLLQPVIPVDGLDPLLRRTVERYAPLTAMRIEATLEIETPRSPGLPFQHKRISGVVASDGRFALSIATPHEDDRGVLTIHVTDELFDGSSYASATRQGGGEAFVVPADSPQLPNMLAHAKTAETLLQWLLAPLPLGRMNHADTERTEESSRSGGARVRITRASSWAASTGTAPLRGFLFDMASGGVPLGAYNLDAQGRRLDTHHFSDHREVVPGILRPMHWELRRFDPTDDTLTQLTRLEVHRASAVDEPLDEVFALGALPVELWDVSWQ